MKSLHGKKKHLEGVNYYLKDRDPLFRDHILQRDPISSYLCFPPPYSPTLTCDPHLPSIGKKKKF